MRWGFTSGGGLEVIPLFCGYDKRESDGFHVFVHSVIARATKEVSIVPLASMGMSHGTNAFTLSRFLVPYLMGYQGPAIFCDASDMLMLSDVAELHALFDDRYALQVVKHPKYATKHKTKYRGADMECPNMDYDRKNWTSVMLMNCAHPAWQWLEPNIYDMPALELLQLKFLPDEQIGELPDSWNRLVDEGHDVADADLIHWTAGMPGFPYYAEAPGSELWRAARKEAFVTNGR